MENETTGCEVFIKLAVRMEVSSAPAPPRTRRLFSSNITFVLPFLFLIATKTFV